MKTTFICLAATASLLAGEGRIAFITFCVKGDNVRILSAELASGTVKHPVVPPQGDLECLLLSAGGDTLFSAMANDPGLPRRVEYGDPSGKISYAVVSGTDSTFVVRLPLPPGATRLTLSRPAPGLAKARSAGRPLGSFQISDIRFKRAGGR
jgi:hypothetical protein